MPHLLSETLVWCVTLLLFGMGLIGTLIPMLPGIIIIAAGCVWQGAMGRENLAWWEWTVLALLVAGGMVIDKLSGGMGAKKFGSTAAGIWGAIIGAVAGSLLFSPIVGLLFMPFLGALLAELIFARKDIMDAFRAGSGAALGMLAGLLLEFTCGLLIIAWFCSCCFLTENHFIPFILFFQYSFEQFRKNCTLVYLNFFYLFYLNFFFSDQLRHTWMYRTYTSKIPVKRNFFCSRCCPRHCK